MLPIMLHGMNLGLTLNYRYINLFNCTAKSFPKYPLPPHE